MCLDRDETFLRGKWILKNGKIVEDSVTKRINKLIDSCLVKITNDKTGWEILYKNPKDDRYWVLIYLDSELQGGGPPSLISISKKKAKSKFNVNDIEMI